MSQQINLFNPIFLKQKKLLSAVTIAQALGLVALGAVALCLYVFFRSAAINSQISATARQLGTAQSQVKQMNNLLMPRQKNRDLEEEIRTKEIEVTALRKAAETLQSQEYGNRSGYSEYLRAFARQIADGIWLTGFTLRGAGSQIELQGHALRPELVAAYLGRLNKEMVLRGKTFETLQISVPQIESPSRAVATRSGASQSGAGNTSTETGVATRIAAPYLAFNLQSQTADKSSATSLASQPK